VGRVYPFNPLTRISLPRITADKQPGGGGGGGGGGAHTQKKKKKIIIIIMLTWQWWSGEWHYKQTLFQNRFFSYLPKRWVFFLYAVSFIPYPFHFICATPPPPTLLCTALPPAAPLLPPLLHAKKKPNAGWPLCRAGQRIQPVVITWGRPT